MAPATKRKLSLAALLAALVAAGALVPMAWKNWHSAPQDTVAVNAAPSAAAPGSEAGPAADAVPPPPPGAETVPAEEAETDRSPNAASPAGPVLSFGRAAGLHLTPDPLRLSSSAALVVDRDSGEVLVQKNAQAVLPIASLTKLMTTLIVMEAKQPMDEVLTITEDDVDNERHSRSRLKVGTTLSRQEALHLALMSSENRAAHALGRNYPGGLPKAVEAMNAKARQLGMKDSSFVDPTGLSNANKSTARDLSLLVKAASTQPLIAEYSTTPQYVATLGSRTLQYINSNRLVRNAKAGWDIDLQKTGYIVEAGRCLTMATEVAGRHLIMVLLDAESNGARVADAERLRRWAVGKLGGPEALAALKAQSAAPRKVAVAASQKDKADRPTRKAASRKDSPKKVAVAKKGDTRKDGPAKAAVSKKSSSGEGRVRQTFAGSKPSDKS
jgi:D-alanyl-D-alanine endopeptidase (penicillin-binding protein 7)